MNPVKLLIVGAAHIDETARSDQPLMLGESNPISWQRTVGGVAANVARAAANHNEGSPVSLLAACGSGAEAIELKSVLADTQVKLITAASPTENPGRYSAIMQHDGTLLIGLADVAQAESISAALIEETARSAAANAIVLDGNLAARTFLELSESTALDCPLLAVSVSPAKAGRLLPVLPKLNVLFANRAEIDALIDTSPQSKIDSTSESIAQTLAKLCATGCSNVVMTDGANGVHIASMHEYAHLAATAVPQAVTLNGPGDALTGASIAHYCPHLLTSPSLAASSLFSALVAAVQQHGLPAARAVLSGEQSAPALTLRSH